MSSRLFSRVPHEKYFSCARAYYEKMYSRTVRVFSLMRNTRFYSYPDPRPPPPRPAPTPTPPTPPLHRVFIVALVLTHPLWNRLTTLSVSGLTSSCGGANDSGTRCVPYVLIGAFRSTDRGSISSLRCRNTCESANDVDGGVDRAFSSADEGGREGGRTRPDRTRKDFAGAGRLSSSFASVEN